MGCSDDSGPPAPRLTLRQVSVTPTAPSKVSVFFTVDTATGDPVTDLQNADVTLFEDSSRLSALETQQHLGKSAASFRAYTAIVLDTTGSVIRGNSLPAVQSAATALAQQLTAAGAEHYVGVFTFDGRPMLTMVQAFTNTQENLTSAIAAISTRQCDTSVDCTMADHNTCVLGSDTGLCIDDSTNLYGAFVEGLSTLDTTLSGATGVPYKIGSLVVFTDGTDQAGRVSRDTAFNRVNNSDHFVYAVGLGSEVDMAFLNLAGKDGVRLISTTADLTGAFTAAGNGILQQTGRYYLLEYCSPKRSGRHEVTLRAVRDEAEGQLTASFSADGFTSGCTITSAL